MSINLFSIKNEAISTNSGGQEGLRETLFLPDDKLAEIFSQFDAHKEMSPLSATCSHWNNTLIPQACILQLNQKEALSMREVLIYQKRISSEEDLNCVFSHSVKLKKLFCSNLAYISGKQLPKSLFNDENVILSTIESVEKYCPKLKLLDFTRCYVVGIRTLRTLSEKKFPELSHLAGFPFSALEEIDFKTPILPCKQLISLDLSKSAIGNWEIIFIADYCPNLRELDLTGSCTMVRTGDVTDMSITVLAKKCSSLTHLSIPYSKITNASLLALGEHCKGLQYFYHYSCSGFNGRDLAVLQQTLPNLVTSNNLAEMKTSKFPKI